MSDKPITSVCFETVEDSPKAHILLVDGKKKFLWKEAFSKQISIEEYKDLILNDRKRSEIHDLTNREGRPYRAMFFWDWDKTQGDRDIGVGNLSLEFPNEEKPTEKEG
jgi:hypothetical protein